MKVKPRHYVMLGAHLATVAVIVISFGTAGEITVPYFVTGVLIESLGRAVSHKKQVG